jgi:signal transduction histidine kinase
MGAAKKVASGDLSQMIQAGTGDDEINQLIASFNEMVEKLRETRALEERLRETEHLTALGQLASGIAHEIRNPLNFISLSIDHLKDKIGSAAPEEREKMANLMTSIKSETWRLNNMVENFLKYGRPMKLEIKWINFNLLLKEVINLAHQKTVEQGIEIDSHLEEIPLIEGDEEKIKTCLMNVIANGIQAMPAGGKLQISASRKQNDILFEILDTGEGITPEDLKKVFQPYFTTKPLGIGLGLALTKRIVEEHHGNIEINSTPGKGTKVTLTLPVRQEKENNE